MGTRTDKQTEKNIGQLRHQAGSNVGCGRSLQGAQSLRDHLNSMLRPKRWDPDKKP